MDLAELQTRVDRYVKLDLAPLYEAYRAQGGGGDVDGFLKFLGTSRIVDASLLKELHGMTDVEIPAVTDAAFAGTMLAAWAGTNVAANTNVGADTKVDAKVGGSTKLGVGDATNPEASPAGAQAAAAPVAAPEPAREIRFQPVTKLGQGAMGAIFIAKDLYLRRSVALKSVLPEMATHEQLLARFLSEMQITAQLEHPNIVPVYALEIGADGSLGYAMKLVQGRDMDQLLDEAREAVEKGQPLDEDHSVEKRLEYFLKVCDALEFAHEKGIVHRDLKPANVMIGRHGEVYLMDWGIARPMGAGGQALEAGIELHQPDGSQAMDLSRTRVGSAIGTPFYMSPEQAEGRNADLDGRSDGYTMGLILQECVSLKRAVGGTTLQEVLTKAKEARRDPVDIGTRVFHVPREIEAIVRKATRLDPKDRYPNIRALADDVRRYLRGEAVSALPEGGFRKAARWVGKNRTTALAIILGLGLVGAAGTIGALVDGQARVAAEHARELRVSQMQTESAIEAQLVDRQLSRYEAALEELVGAAELALGRQPPGDFPPYFDAELGGPNAPPDYGPSKRYGKPISVFAPVVTLAPGVDREPLMPLLRSLGVLSPSFRALLIGSSGADWHVMSPAQQRAAIADAGVAVYRASLGLREGVTLSFPAVAGLPATDPRTAAAYKAAETKRGVVWGKPEAGEKGAVLPATAPLYDESGAFRGVASIEVSLDRLLDRPGMEDLDYVQSRMLVGRDGNVVTDQNKPDGRAPMAPEVLSAIAAGKSGSMVATVAGKSWQYAYYPLSTLDWYYVAAGEVTRMMASKAKVVSSDPRKIIAAWVPAPPPVAATAAAAPAPPPKPVEIPDAGAAGGAEARDAGADGGVPWWKVRGNRLPGAKPPAAPAVTAAPTAAPAAPPPPAEPPPPPNPFDKWKVYEKKGQ